MDNYRVRLIKNFFHAILSCGKDRGEVKDMLCHLVIDLNKELCTRSDDGTKLVQR